MLISGCDREDCRSASRGAVLRLSHFGIPTQLLLDKYGLDDDACDDLVDEVRDHIINTFKGDSLIVAGDTGEDKFGAKATLKLHFHTNEPWLVLEYCRSLGEIYDIVVEDMDRQTRGLHG